MTASHRGVISLRVPLDLFVSRVIFHKPLAVFFLLFCVSTFLYPYFFVSRPLFPSNSLSLTSLSPTSLSLELFIPRPLCPLTSLSLDLFFLRRLCLSTSLSFGDFFSSCLYPFTSLSLEVFVSRPLCPSTS